MNRRLVSGAYRPTNNILYSSNFLVFPNYLENYLTNFEEFYLEKAVSVLGETGLY